LFNDGNKQAFDEAVDLVRQYLPEAKILPPRLSGDSPGKVLVEFEEEGTTFDISTSGGGLRTVLNLATVLLFSDSRCILCDEPDSHLHASLQKAVAQMLFDFSMDRDCQIMVATHAPDFIGELPVESVVWIDRSKTEGQTCPELGRVLADLGAISKADAIRAFGVDKILFLEGGVDRAVLPYLFGLTSGKNPFEDSTVLVVQLPSGKGDAAHLPVFKQLLHQTFHMDVALACIADNDYELAEELAAPEPTSEAPLVVSLGRKEVENYLLDPATMVSAIRAAANRRRGRTGATPSTPSAEDVGAELKRLVEADEVRDVLRWQVVPRYRASLDPSLDPSEKERLAEEWFSDKWSDPDWRLRHCPGKLILSRMRRWVQDESGLTISTRDLATGLSECPADIADIARALNTLFYGAA